MTRMTTYLFLATWLIAWPVTAQENSVDWTHLPWGSDHATFLAPYGTRVVEYPEQKSLYSSGVHSHYKVSAVDFAGVEFELSFREDLGTHHLAQIYLQWATRTGDWAAHEKVVQAAKAKLIKFFGPPSRTTDFSINWFTETTHAMLIESKSPGPDPIGRVSITFSRTRSSN